MLPYQKILVSLLLALPLMSFADTPKTHAPSADKNPLIDSDGFLRDVLESLRLRESRLISEEQFVELAKDPETIVLDARSSLRFEQIHIVGAKSLPFTEFTVHSLKQLIPSKNTRIVIYCNNNFLNNTPATRIALTSKFAPASLNLSTFTSLYTYGYRNVFELRPLIDTKSTKLLFQGSLVRKEKIGS